MRKVLLLTFVAFVLSACSNEGITSKKVKVETTETSKTAEEKTTEEATNKVEESPKSSANVLGSLSPMQAERLANGMADFGKSMGQHPYIKTDVPRDLTWENGEKVSGYTIFESYIYQNGSTTHRYFFVLNPRGATEVLYSTGGKTVKPTANFDVHAIFANAYGNSGAATAPSLTRGYLSAKQSADLALGMENFGREMGQNPYVKTDVPLYLTWEGGMPVTGYTIYESYIYQGGGETHRYFFVRNNFDGNVDVLYSSGGTTVRRTINNLVSTMFWGMFNK